MASAWVGLGGTCAILSDEFLQPDLGLASGKLPQIGGFRDSTICFPAAETVASCRSRSFLPLTLLLTELELAVCVKEAEGGSLHLLHSGPFSCKFCHRVRKTYFDRAICLHVPKFAD